VIAFEGVDGAGKSTVLALVAAHLRASGVTVSMPRVGKEHSSKPIREIRRLTRDRSNLSLLPRAESLLYASREAQVLDEHVRPALARGETVLLDRSMLTSIVIGAYGRGLELESCEAIATHASAGLDVDLTLIFDVDPRTSRIRKRLEKIRSKRSRDGGRKGLSGSGFKERIRSGYLEIASRDHLPVFHTERSGPREVADRVIALLEHGAFTEPPEDQTPWFITAPNTPFEDAVTSLPPLVQLYFTRRAPLGRTLRAGLFETEPELTIWATDLEDPLLVAAAELAPELVLSRLGSQASSLVSKDALRQRLLASHPVEVARSLVRVAGDEADRMRVQLAESAPGAVVESLAGRSDAFATALRDRLWKHADGYERAISLQDCDDPESWRRRDKLLQKDPALVISNLRGLAIDRVDPILARYAELAPKPVLQALNGRGDATAHALRHQLLDAGREVIDSVIGLDDPSAWALREQTIERWPSTVAWSLGGLADHPKTAAMLERCRACAPTDLFVTRRLYQAAASSSPVT
jgi:dTMP kinase